MRRLRVLACCSLLLAVFGSPQAFAYNAASDINYSMGTETLSGYFRTWKDPWDVDYANACLYWEWDDVYGLLCAVLVEEWALVHVVGEVSSPDGQLRANGDAGDWRDAQWNYSDSVTTLAAGNWSGAGHHYQVIYGHVWYCSSSVGGCYIAGAWEEWNHFADTQDQATVCTTGTSVIDAAGVSFLIAWPSQPWEMSMGIYCRQDPNLPLEYRNYYFSFGGTLASNDPCATYSPPGSADMAGDMHTHPWFSSLGWIEEMNAGLGCGGATGNPITFTDYIFVWAWLHGSGAEFSAGDRNATMFKGKPGYMRVPAGNTVKKVMPDGTESQVYP